LTGILLHHPNQKRKENENIEKRKKNVDNEIVVI